MDGFPPQDIQVIFYSCLKFTYCTNCIDCKYAFQINININYLRIVYFDIQFMIYKTIIVRGLWLNNY